MKSKLNKQFADEIADQQKKAKKFNKLFMRDTPVDIGKAITEYLKFDAVQNLFSDLKNWAEEQHVPSVAEMNRLTVGLLKIFQVKSGY